MAFTKNFMQRKLMGSLSWYDRSPSQRCDWLDLIRGWSAIIMIEVHCTNAWLQHGLIPTWVEFLNGLVAPGFIMCVGYSQALSTFKIDGSIRPFWLTAKRLMIIALCAYTLHAPRLFFSNWPTIITQQDFREFFKVDVLQCIAVSALILHGFARVIRQPIIYAIISTILGVGVALVAPSLWQPNVANGLWLPIRGFVNGNVDRGVIALFPLAPWFAFAAFGSALGIFYRQMRIVTTSGQTKWSEAKWLVVITVLGTALCLWSSCHTETWLASRHLSQHEQLRLHNTTLPSVTQRFSTVCIVGGVLCWFDSIRSKLPGPNVIKIASRESLFIYMLHLTIIFGFLLAEPIRNYTGWQWHSLNWTKTITITIAVTIINIIASIKWNQLPKDLPRVKKLQKAALTTIGIWIIGISVGASNLFLAKVKTNYVNLPNQYNINKIQNSTNNACGACKKIKTTTNHKL